VSRRAGESQKNASHALLFNIREQKGDEDSSNTGFSSADVQASSHVYGQSDPDLFFGTRGSPVDAPQDRGEQGTATSAS
jgi:hypothetical protein